jgi:predicted RNA binding protein YcfA (HicA-like mRNA interferase family)
VTRHAKALIKTLTNLGFDHIWTNSSGHHCYVHPADPDQTELLVNPSANEVTHRSLTRRAQKITGTVPATPKRNPRQIKQRAETDRTRARALLDEARNKARQLQQDQADRAAIDKASQLIAQRERELAAIERLMRQAPAGGSTHRGAGQARHQAGGRA